MRYLITTTDITCPPFLTNYFEPENHFDSEIGMIVYDLHTDRYTTDGIAWNALAIDHL